MIRSAQLGIATAVVVTIGGAFLILSKPGANVGTPPSTPATSASPVASASASVVPPVAACTLLTTTQAATLGGSGLGATTAGSGTGAETRCRYANGAGDAIVDITDTSTGGRAAFEAVKAGVGAQVVADLGIDAVYDPSSQSLYVVSADRLVAIRAGNSGQTDAARLAFEHQFAELIVPNLTAN